MGLNKTAPAVVAGTDGVATWANAVVTDLSNIISHGEVYEESDGATITFDLDNSKVQKVELAGNRTIAFSNVKTNQTFSVILKQDSTGSRTVTWPAAVKWVYGGTAPVLTTTAEKYDIFVFIAISASYYLGFVAGQNG